MITALISTIMGIVGGAVPKLLSLWERKQDFAHEKEMLVLQTEAAKVASSLRVQEIQETAIIEELKAHRDEMQSLHNLEMKSTTKFVDAWNAMIRPFTCTLIVLMFIVVASIYSYGVIHTMWLTNGIIDATGAAQLLWTSLVGEAIQAVLGYLFGYRTTRAVFK